MKNEAEQLGKCIDATRTESLDAVTKAEVHAADEVGDDVTVDLFTQRMNVSQKTAWMLRSSI